jgi:hypothetical protein
MTIYVSCPTQYSKYVDGDPSHSLPPPLHPTYNFIYVIHIIYAFVCMTETHAKSYSHSVTEDGRTAENMYTFDNIN